MRPSLLAFSALPLALTLLGCSGKTVEGGSHKTQASGSLPCDVDQVLTNNCRKCHTDPPSYGSPMPLKTYADLMAPSYSDPSAPIYKMIEKRIHGDPTRMPPNPNPPLSDPDTKVLDDWIAAGAPPAAAGDSCSTDGGAPGDGGIITNPLSCTPDVHVAPPTPWEMPATLDGAYVCYGFDVPLKSERDVIAIAPRVDNKTILHHMLLFQTDTSYGSTPKRCDNDMGMNWRLIYGWAPGASTLVLPDNVGIPETGTAHFIAQIHYDNSQLLSGQKDTSGFDLCTTDTPRPNKAGVIAFGTMKFTVPAHGSLDISCKFPVPAGTPTMHAVAALPHMHEIGKLIETTQRVGGQGTPLPMGKKDPWNFEEQSWVPINNTVSAGDVVTTRCAWDNTTNKDVSFGLYTQDEMCFSFTMFYPWDPDIPWLYPSYASQCSPTK